MNSLWEERDVKKSTVSEPKKSSMQILSELFSTFDAEPPVIVKKEKKEKTEESSKKSKKSKKKHKHKDKKHKKKSKKKKRSSSRSSSSSIGGDSEIDLAHILIKNEKGKSEKKIKIEGTSLSLDIPELLPDIKNEIKKEELKLISERNDELSTNVNNDSKDELAGLKKSLGTDNKKRKIKHEDGEITDSETESRKHKKHKHKDKDKQRRYRSNSRERSRSREKLKHGDLRHKIKKEHTSPDKNHQRTHHHSKDKESLGTERRDRDRSRSRDKHRDKYKDDYDREYRGRHRGRELPSYRDSGFYKHRDKSKDRERSREKERSKDRDRERSRERDRAIREEKWFMRDRYRGHGSFDKSLDRARSRDRDDSSSRIDKKKLLEIARRNAVQMMKSGSLPGALSLSTKAQEKMIAAIKSGGKTIEELTDFCKSLSKKEELGELSSMSEKEESDTEGPFHHPFQIKDRPTTITMNIKNSIPLPTKTTQERTTELRMQFPVSSGQQHRVTEEWIPVTPTSTNAHAAEVEKSQTSNTPSDLPLEIEPPPPLPVSPPVAQVPLPPEPVPSLIPAPPNAPPGPQMFPSGNTAVEATPKLDISSVVSQRLTAMRKLQENPHDVQALSEMYKSNKKMQTWAKSKQQLGQFTGTTGAQVLSQAELSSGYQAWAKKDQLQTAAPVSGGMGMHLLQKMGWKPGEGLGKEKTGSLEPLLLEIKLDKKGLVTNEEQTKGKRKNKGTPTVKTLQGKHPVSLLGEYASKRKLGAPQYILEFECGPDHKKNFLFKVVIDGVEYKPNIASASKKEAKANAATLALKQIGLLL